MITVVNYGMGNIRSVTNALQYLGVPSRVTNKPEDILQSEKLVLPGVGSFFTAMRNLRNINLVEPLNEVVQIKKRPILGICLGMQLLAESGTENGEVQGLGWIPGKVVRFNFNDPSCRIPHTGFNAVKFGPTASGLYKSLAEQADFYFVHSYHFECSSEYITGKTNYHGEFVASVARENIHGVQFHPEKSQSNGLIVLRNFVEIQ